MRTSKVSQETDKIFNALSPNTVHRRSTRQAAKSISAFRLSHDGSIDVDERNREGSLSTESAVSITFGTDIEDSLTVSRSPRKRKRGSESPSTTVISTTATTTTTITTSKTRTSPRKQHKPDTKDDDDDDDDDLPSASPHGRAKALPKTPARKTTLADGSVQVRPPSNWEAIYETVKAMRVANPTAPVDTMGCEDLYWRSSSPKEQRYHILTALMLSSQTKDTVTAAAMQRLHTELGPLSEERQPQSRPSSSLMTTTTTTTTTASPFSSSSSRDSTLTIANILATPPEQLNGLISKVGFHNTKTRHLQQTAAILSTRHDGDVPRSVAELVSLPGVGPKMAYLCLSAAWGIDAGIGVDVHVHRITNLWGWHVTKNPEDTRRCLQAWLPTDKWHEINRLLVGLGQTVCLPVGRRCGDCRLAGTGLCKAEVRGWKAKEVKRKKKTSVTTTTPMTVGLKNGTAARDHEQTTLIKAEEEENARRLLPISSTPHGADG